MFSNVSGSAAVDEPITVVLLLLLLRTDDEVAIYVLSQRNESFLMNWNNHEIVFAEYGYL